MKTQKLNKIRGRVYGIFPGWVDLEDGDFHSDEDSFLWKYFDWVFDFIAMCYGFMFDLTNGRPMFIIKLSEEELSKLSKEAKAKLELYK